MSETPTENETQVTSALLYRDRHDWTDIKPIYFSPEEEGAVKIAVSDEFRDAFAYLRAILQIDERSDRALELTETCSRLNPANYTVWQFRRTLIKALEKDLSEELKFCQDAICENPKNYQVWHHRRVLVEWLKDPSNELDFTADILADDTKNYHAWQHRQWAVNHFNLFGQSEIDFSFHMLADDVRNNSAWNYRYFIVQRLSNDFKETDVVGKEVTFCLSTLSKIPGNESAWNYLSGILLEDGVSSRSEVIEFCNALYDTYRDNPELTNREKSPHLLSFMVDIIIELLDKKQDVEENMKRATELLDELKLIDPVRRKYWAYQQTMIQNLVASG